QNLPMPSPNFGTNPNHYGIPSFGSGFGGGFSIRGDALMDLSNRDAALFSSGVDSPILMVMVSTSIFVEGRHGNQSSRFSIVVVAGISIDGGATGLPSSDGGPFLINEIMVVVEPCVFSSGLGKDMDIFLKPHFNEDFGVITQNNVNDTPICISLALVHGNSVVYEVFRGVGYKLHPK
ncbi:hypothetical protein KI387_021504, partial [Taxus chinensis]